MAPFGKIYSYPGNFRVDRAQVVAAFNGLEVPLAENFKVRVDNQTPEFLAKFPLGKVPALECADGFCIAESAAICYHLARSGPKKDQLLGADTKTQSLIDQWAFFAETELVANILPPAAMVYYKIIPVDSTRYEQSAASAERALKRVEVALKDGQKFLVGDNVTLADILVGGGVFFAANFLLDAEMRKELPNVVAWAQRLAALPEFKALGEFKLLETRIKS
ncbi:glutathione S-transferase [Daldinia caldariorum]|uniref:glutathione S-transferase n=1 Tax=Daldinia caldariorum TaxID=326644 RepID=UPI00200751C7|nr:glutathione S-transferase [Daldinia caldariorum]KAI1470929.1 glutathione S-transferase [Daldinia caldariorum]